MQSVDILIIGGGINGAAIACEAASRGLQTVLAEQHDIASGASSATNGLLSADMRHLESLDWNSVKRALGEQAIVQQRAPHLVQTREFHIAPNPRIRSSRRLRTGLYLYDLLQSVELQQPLPTHTPELYLKPDFNQTHRYTDCTVSDSRLTICNALLARDLGAEILTRHKVVAAQRQRDGWRLSLQSDPRRTPTSLQAKVLVNAGGRAIDSILRQTLQVDSRCHTRLLRSDHLVIDKPFQGEQAYVFQAVDRRLVYLIPYAEKFAVLGATQPLATGAEGDSQQALIELYNRHFNQPLKASEIRHGYSCVQPIYHDLCGSEADSSSDYLLDFNCPDARSPVLTVIGGWLTSSRLLAEQALDILQPYTQAPINRELKQTPLPGGEFIEAESGALLELLKRDYPRLDATLLQRLAKNYGSLALKILGDCKVEADLGKNFGCGLYGAEVRYPVHHEWAQTAEDSLLRRTKLGLVMSGAEQGVLAEWMSGSYE